MDQNLGEGMMSGVYVQASIVVSTAAREIVGMFDITR
jgi:hypothetical protein